MVFSYHGNLCPCCPNLLRKKANLTMSGVKLPAATGEQKLSGLFSLGYGGQSAHALCTCFVHVHSTFYFASPRESY